MKHDILSHLPGDFPWQVHWFDTIDSTNDRAKAIADQGAPHGTVLIAGHQTKGRGRMGRTFCSPKGQGLYLSVILRPDQRAHELMHLTCGVGVAVCDAIETVTGYRPGIKWINDLVADGKKLGGILTELSVDPKSGTVRYAIIGIGINCSQKQADFPAEIQDIAISLESVTGQKAESTALAAAIIQSLYKMNPAAKEESLAAYKKDCITLGKEIVVLQNEEKRYGTAIGIDKDGSLLVTFRDGTTQAVNSGEVSIRGMYGYV